MTDVDGASTRSPRCPMLARMALPPHVARTEPLIALRGVVKTYETPLVEVANSDHLYLAGRAMIPTHNSTLGLDLCRSASIRHQLIA